MRGILERWVAPLAVGSAAFVGYLYTEGAARYLLSLTWLGAVLWLVCGLSWLVGGILERRFGVGRREGSG